MSRFCDDGAEACLLAVMALSDAPEPVQKTVRAMLAGWTAELTATLADAGAPDPDAEAQDRIPS